MQEYKTKRKTEINIFEINLENEFGIKKNLTHFKHKTREIGCSPTYAWKLIEKLVY